MNVLSLFDGMSCGQLAINRLGLSYDKYFASEVDKYAIKVTMSNFPNTIQIGDVREVNASIFSDNPITLMMGGSPCQSFSFAGKRKGMSTKDNIEILSLDQYLELKQNNFEFEGQSYLFWEYIRLLNEVKPKYFLLENVMMEERWEKIITKTIGVHPLDINSSLVSAQNRRRLYWTNIGLEPQGLFGDLEQTIGQPKEKGILLKDILEDNPNAKHYMSERFTKSVMSNPRNRITSNINEKSNTLCARQDSGSDLLGIIDEKYYLSDRMIEGLKNHKERHLEKKTGFIWNPSDGNEKANCLRASSSICATDNTIICHSTQKRSEDRPSVKDNKNAGGSGQLSRDDGKSYCLDRANSMAIEVRKVIQLNESKESHNQQPFQQNRIYDVNGISPALQAQLPNGSHMILNLNENQINKFDLNVDADKHNCLTTAIGRAGSSSEYMDSVSKIAKLTSRIRRLTPVECERLQTVPDNYTNHVSDSQRYKMLGNGWTIDVIAHILKHIK